MRAVCLTPCPKARNTTRRPQAPALGPSLYWSLAAKVREGTGLTLSCSKRERFGCSGVLESCLLSRRAMPNPRLRPQRLHAEAVFLAVRLLKQNLLGSADRGPTSGMVPC